MKRDLFQYTTPLTYELKELYPTPYRFSTDLRDHVDMLFSHPYNKHNNLFYNSKKEYDSNDMIKPMYLLVKYFLDNPQQYKHKLENIHAEILIRGWKVFLSLHKFRGNTFDKYKPTDLVLLDIGGGNILDLLLNEIKFHRMIMSADSMVTSRKGLGLRESHRAGMKEGSKSFEYLCGLE